EARALLAERNELRAQAREHALQTAQVLATTFGTLARIAEDLPRAVTAVVDEATQATEPAVWVAVPWVKRLLLVGDPHQLGPVVKTGDPILSQPLLNRLVDAGVPLPMLEVQYRMAPAIRELVAEIYGPTYRDAPGLADRAGEVVFVDTAGAGAEERDPLTSSLYEPAEIDAVARLVEAEIARGTPRDRIVVVTPYSAQVSRLRARAELAGIEVGTVNAMQGREQDVVIVSFVRSNHDGDLGFVADDRRLTVALTRARHRLYLVGDTGTLARNARFARLIDRIADAGGLRSVWDET
ncbi:MAG: AAA family ATPase, partial [Myxococcales bacterium]|nr:AAA family ATPase [Myxococcales bacterium]